LQEGITLFPVCPFPNGYCTPPVPGWPLYNHSFFPPLTFFHQNVYLSSLFYPSRTRTTPTSCFFPPANSFNHSCVCLLANFIWLVNNKMAFPPVFFLLFLFLFFSLLLIASRGFLDHCAWPLYEPRKPGGEPPPPLEPPFPHPLLLSSNPPFLFWTVCSLVFFWILRAFFLPVISSSRPPFLVFWFDPPCGQRTVPFVSYSSFSPPKTRFISVMSVCPSFWGLSFIVIRYLWYPFDIFSSFSHDLFACLVPAFFHYPAFH